MTPSIKTLISKVPYERPPPRGRPSRFLGWIFKHRNSETSILQLPPDIDHAMSDGNRINRDKRVRRETLISEANSTEK